MKNKMFIVLICWIVFIVAFTIKTVLSIDNIINDGFTTAIMLITISKNLPMYIAILSISIILASFYDKRK